MLHCDHNVSKDLQELLDRQNYFTKIPMIILSNRSFQDKGDGSVGIRIKGEVKGGGTEKTEKEKEMTEK